MGGFVHLHLMQLAMVQCDLVTSHVRDVKMWGRISRPVGAILPSREEVALSSCSLSPLSPTSDRGVDGG